MNSLWSLFFIAFSPPLDELSYKMPNDNLFSVENALSVNFQKLIHHSLDVRINSPWNYCIYNSICKIKINGLL